MNTLAFQKIRKNYPDIKIVAEQGIGGPDFPGDAEKAASAMIVSNSDLDGIWAVWDQPAEGVMEAARANGKDDLIIPKTKDLQFQIKMLKNGLKYSNSIIPRNDNDPLPPFDCHSPLLSLPRIFQTTLETIPSSDSYLKPDKVLHSKFQKLISADSLNIGIAWAGKSTHKNDHNRSTGLEPFIELFGNNKIAFHSLQVGPRSDDIMSKGCQGLVRDYSNMLENFADTAALISNLDLVITVDTSVCHLSGALGVPCWVILPHACDWRWMTKRGDSPWYSSICLFRQKHFGDWKDVFDNIAKALLKKVKDGEKSPS